MSLFELLDVDFNFKDNRGELNQLVHGGYQQVNVLYSKKGVVRGGHFHKKATEAFFVVDGSVEVSLKNMNDSDVEVFKKGQFFKIRPNIIHSMRFLEDCTLVALYDVPVDKEDGSKDIYTEDFYEEYNKR